MIIIIKNYKNFFKKASILTLVLTMLVGCSTGKEQAKTDTNTNTETQKIQNKSENLESKNFITSETAQSMLKNKDQYYQFDDIENLLEGKKPFVYTYYIDQSDLEGEEPSETMIVEMIYPIQSNEKSSALKIYTQYQEIADIKIDEFTGVPGNDYADTTYKTNYYSDKKLLSLNKDFTFNNEFIDSFKGQDIYTLNEKFDVSNANTESFLKNSNLNINFYLVSELDNNEATKGLYVLTENNQIKGMKMGEPFFDLNKLDTLFDSKTYEVH